MKTFIKKNFRLMALLMLLVLSTTLTSQELKNPTEYKGTIIDNTTSEALEAVSINLKNTNINTISNAEGSFVLKIPENSINGIIVFSILGYEPMEVNLTSLQKGDNKIKMTPRITNLSEVNLKTYTDPAALVKLVFNKKKENNLNDPTVMTAFYRESIKKRNRNVSLTEAVVNLYKQPYASNAKDIIELSKARKSTDYDRLDTVSLKLQGGPFAALYLDVMKYPEYIFNNESYDTYTYKFEAPSNVTGRPVFVVSFIDKLVTEGAYYKGKLYIDSETLALTSATYNLEIVDRKEASKIFVRKKPSDVNVYPISTMYHVDYREKDGKWYYGYSNMELSFVVDKKRKFFNTTYTLTTEMAVTDWANNISGDKPSNKNRLKPTVVMSDEVSGFSDPDFWGPYNLIEPEKSIESAINKIQRKLEKNKS